MEPKSKPLLGLIVFFILAVPGLALAAGTGALEGKLESKKKKYRRNAVVYLEKVPGKYAPKKNAQMDQKNQTFLPFILPVVKGTTVEFLNNDNTGHNVFSPDGEEYNLGTWPKGEVRTYTFNKEGVYTQLCKLHPSMLAYVVVLQNPFFAVTKDDGSFKLTNVPPGTYTVKVWHERRRAEPVAVDVKSGATARLTIKMKK